MFVRSELELRRMSRPHDTIPSELLSCRDCRDRRWPNPWGALRRHAMGHPGGSPATDRRLTAIIHKTGRVVSESSERTSGAECGRNSTVWTTPRKLKPGLLKCHRRIVIDLFENE